MGRASQKRLSRPMQTPVILARPHLHPPAFYFSLREALFLALN